MAKINKVKVVILVTLLSSVLAGCESGNRADRPRDPWVFRSVLDNKPRMITVALHDNLYVSYDAQACQLYKAWKGGVVFDGAVYTTHHGPQPSSKGYAYFTQSDKSSFWYLVINGKDVP